MSLHHLKPPNAVVVLQSADRGNYASRLCHSCSPNCQTVSICTEGHVTNALFTLRDIQEGEELTWDYSCVTESEKEYRAAICLCGTSACRGSFLYYADSSAFRDVTPVCICQSSLEKCIHLGDVCTTHLPRSNGPAAEGMSRVTDRRRSISSSETWVQDLCSSSCV